MTLKQFLSAFSEKTECSIDVTKTRGGQIVPGDIIFNGTIGKAMQVFDEGKYIVHSFEAYKEKLIVSVNAAELDEDEQRPTLKKVMECMNRACFRLAVRGTERDKMPPEVFPYKEISDATEALTLSPRCVIDDIFIWQNGFYIRATKID